MQRGGGAGRGVFGDAQARGDVPDPERGGPALVVFVRGEGEVLKCGPGQRALQLSVLHETTQHDADRSFATAIDGDFAGTSFALFATIGHMIGSIVAGTIDNIPVRVDAKAQAPDGPTNVIGSCHGPEALLALMVGAVLFLR